MTYIWAQDDRSLRNHFVYWLFSAEGECLYVGCTRRPKQRWEQHRVTRKAMVAETATRRMAGPYTFAVAHRIEREQQDLLNPRYDRRLVGIEAATRSRADTRRRRQRIAERSEQSA
jgi:predicted GIY-YIG superfamily endonuclease